MAAAPATPGRGEMVDQLIATAVGEDNPETLAKALAAVAPPPGGEIEDWQIPVLKTLIDSLNRKKLTLASFAAAGDAEIRAGCRSHPTSVCRGPKTGG